jgi:hypothetical protein
MKSKRDRKREEKLEELLTLQKRACLDVKRWRKVISMLLLTFQQ